MRAGAAWSKVNLAFEVRADCATIEDALLVIRKKSVDVVLLDFDFGQRDGWDFLRFAAEQEFKGKQVVTAGVETAALSELILSGISGIFRKHIPPVCSPKESVRLWPAKFGWTSELQNATQHPRRDRESLRGPTVHRTRTAGTFLRIRGACQ